MRYGAIMGLGVAGLMLAGGPAYTRAGSTGETPTAADKMEPKAGQLGSKAKTVAKEAKSDATDAKNDLNYTPRTSMGQAPAGEKK